MNDLFQINRKTPSENIPKVKEDKPRYIIETFAELVSVKTNGEFTGRVLSRIIDDEIQVQTRSGRVTFAFYVIAKDFIDISYRLVELSISSIIKDYPLTLDFFALQPDADEHFTCNDSETLRERLTALFKSDKTGNILGRLDELIQIREIENKQAS